MVYLRKQTPWGVSLTAKGNKSHRPPLVPNVAFDVIPPWLLTEQSKGGYERKVHTVKTTPADANISHNIRLEGSIFVLK